MYYTAHFCTDNNSTAREVYVSISAQRLKRSPYNTEINRIYNFPGETEINNGKLLRLTTEVIDQKTIDCAGKVICPDFGEYSQNSQYEGKVFIIGKNLHTYNIDNKQLTPFEYPPYFIDIIYNELHDQLFAFTNNEITTGDSHNRSIKLWEISTDAQGDAVIDASTKNEIKGQAAAIFSNPYNNRIYVHRKIDNKMLGASQMSLCSFDPYDTSPEWVIEPLDLTNFAPTYDQTSDPWESLFYNITTPFIDNNNNKIHIPNGGFSCFSVVDFEPNEALYLRGEESDGITWISFPRLIDNTQQTTPVETVLGPFENGIGNILPQDFESGLGDTNTYLTNLVRGQPYSNRFFLYWDDQDPQNLNWNVGESFISDINSTYGYKIQLKPYQKRTLFMQGQIQNANTSFNLVDGSTVNEKENWVGYYIHETQDIFDALEPFIDDIYAIKHQDYYCHRMPYLPDNGQPTPIPTFFACDKEEHNIKYGDMIILKTYSDINSFSWNYSGKPPSAIVTENPKHFTYTETPDYSALIIELDSTENPLELGAFVNDSCIGACTVSIDDSLAIIKGYLDGQSGDSIVFEEYFGTKSSNNKRISDYYVLNEKQNLLEKRTIKTRENRDRYFISFKDKGIMENINDKLDFKVYPNPSQNVVNIEFAIDQKSTVSIAVFDSFGRKLTTLVNCEKIEGNHMFKWNLNNNGYKVNNGIYIIKLTINNETISKKLIIN